MKIMKKSFSFVCCLFLAVSCFAPFAAASDPSKKAVVAKGNTSVANVSGVQASAGRIVEHTKVIEHTKVVEFADVSATRASAASSSSAVAAANAGRAPGYATPAGHGEHVFFTLKANPNIHLSIPSARKGAFTYGGGPSDDVWFTAWLNSDNSYVLQIGRRAVVEKGWPADSRFGLNLVLDQYLENSNIHAHPPHGGANQRWVFIPTGDGYYRIQNVYKGEYLTYNPSDKRVYGFHYIEPSRSDVGDQIWQKH